EILWSLGIVAVSVGGGCYGDRRFGEGLMKTRNRAERYVGPKLPPPLDGQFEDWVNDLGWFSRGPADRADRAADAQLEPLLLRDDESTGLPPDPVEPPRLPDPPTQPADDEFRSAEAEEPK